MSELVVDLTPTCINRTAIYHIAHDTLAALKQDFTVSLQIRGERTDAPRDRAEERGISEDFAGDVARWVQTSVHADEIELGPPRGDRVPRLFFDPIYTLYHGLEPQDVVFVLDLSTLTNPEWHDPAVARVYERAFRKLLGSQARIVSISQHCTAALRANFSVPADDIVTVPLYLRDLSGNDALAPQLDLHPRRFLLCVGSLELRKNAIGLIQAFAITGLANEGWRLVIAGGNGQGWQAITEAACRVPGVDLPGFVSDAELRWLYENAAAFVYPSFLEGFGLPLLEAMACGLPCMASTTGASREVCGELALCVDPHRQTEIIDGLLTCAGQGFTSADPQRRLLRERARSFSFERYYRALRPALVSRQ